MKILVTGWNGHNISFIPQAVANHLKQKGHEVHGWEWDTDWNNLWPTIYGWVWSEKYQRYMHATPDSKQLDWDVSPLESYDYVIHLGAISSTTEGDVEKIMKQNFDFSLWLLNQCQKHQIPMQFASSASVYGQTRHFDEEMYLEPQSPYAFSKYMFDRIIRDNAKFFKTPVIGLRYFNVYGPYEEGKGEQASLVNKWETESATHGCIKIFNGSDNFYRDFINIDDVCNIHEKLLDKKYKGILNVGTGVATNISKLCEHVCAVSGCISELIPMPKELKRHYQAYTCSNNTRLYQVIGEYDFLSVEEYFEKNFIL
jgi:ADP-L-glycero-D-manno-heptose 6-epimerase